MLSWQRAETFEDVCRVGKGWLQGRVKRTPFSYGSSSGLHPDTVVPASMRPLLALHDRGALTIESQSACLESKECSGFQKSYVSGFVDRRAAREMASRLRAVPNTLAYVYDFSSRRRFGNFQEPTPQQRRTRSDEDEYWVLTRTGHLPTKRINEHNPARPPFSIATTSFLVGRRQAYDALGSARSGEDGRPGSERLARILRESSAFFFVCNTRYGEGPEASAKVLAALRPPRA